MSNQDDEQSLSEEDFGSDSEFSDEREEFSDEEFSGEEDSDGDDNDFPDDESNVTADEGESWNEDDFSSDREDEKEDGDDVDSGAVEVATLAQHERPPSAARELSSESNDHQTDGAPNAESVPKPGADAQVVQQDDPDSDSSVDNFTTAAGSVDDDPSDGEESVSSDEGHASKQADVQPAPSGVESPEKSEPPKASTNADAANDAQLEQLKAELAAAKKEVADANEQLQKLQKENEDLAAKNDGLQNETGSLQKDKETLQAQNDHNLEKLKELQNIRDELQDLRAQKQADSERSDASAQNQQAEVDELRAKVQGIQQKDEEIKSLQQQVQTLQDSETKKSSEVVQLRKEVKDLKEQCATVDETHQDAALERDKLLQAHAEDLEAVKQQCSAKVDAAEQELLESSKKADKLSDDLQQSETLVTTLRAEMKALEATLSENEAALACEQQATSNAAKERDEARIRADDLDALNQELRQTLAKSNTEVQRLRDDLKNLKARTTDVDSVVADKDKQIAEYVADLSAWARRTRHLPWIQHISVGQSEKLEPARKDVIETQRRRIEALESELEQLRQSAGGERSDGDSRHEDGAGRGRSKRKSRKRSKQRRKGGNQSSYSEFLQQRERQHPQLRGTRTGEDTSIRCVSFVCLPRCYVLSYELALNREHKISSAVLTRVN